MAFDTQPMNGKPILLQTLHPDYTGADTTGLLSEAKKILDGLSQQVYYILDLRAINLSFGDIVMSANYSTREDQPAFHHPNVIETLVVTRAAALRIAALRLQHPVFGNAKLKMFETYEEALAYCDQ